MKIIKLPEEHYIVVDDSEIQIGDWYIDDVKSIRQSITSDQDYWSTRKEYKKITHSTNIDWNEVYYIPLSEVKALLGEVDVEKKARDFATRSVNPINPIGTITCLLSQNGYEKGYTQCLKDNKDKKYTETDIKNAIIRAYSIMGNIIDVGYFNEVIQSLQPKTEWEVEFVDGKLKLK